MQTFFGLEIPAALRWVLALAFVLVLAAILSLFLRRVGGGRMRLKGQGAARARQPRLGVIDIYDLDRQRQLVLLRRDNVEHLVMIGGPTDVVVETNILRGARVAAPQAGDGERLESDVTFAPLPAAPAASVTVAANAPAAPRAALTEESALPAAAVATVAAVTTAATATAGQLQSAAASPDLAVPAKVLPVSPEARSEPTTLSQKEAPRPDAALAFPLQPSPSPNPSATDLDDMARQLEQALKRPFAAVRSAAPGQASTQAADTKPQDDGKAAKAVTPDAPAAVVPAPKPDMAAELQRGATAQVPGPAVQPEAPADKAPDSFEAMMAEQLDDLVKAPVAPASQPPATAGEMKVQATETKAKSAPVFGAGVLAAATVVPPVASATADAVKSAKPEDGVAAGRADAGPLQEPAVKPANLADDISAQLQAAMSQTLADASAKSEAMAKTSEPVKTAEPPKVAETAIPAGAARQPKPADVAKPAEPAVSPEPAKTAEADTVTPPGPKTDAAKVAANADETDPFSIDAIEQEFARLLGRETQTKS